jgi:hypothetical protein
MGHRCTSSVKVREVHSPPQKLCEGKGVKEQAGRALYRAPSHNVVLRINLLACGAEVGVHLIYSQLKTCSSSEVAAMIEGVLRHCTEMEVDQQYVDSHGQSEVAFAFCHLLGFQLLPRLKAIHRQRLYRPEADQPAAYPHLQSVLSRPIRWELIA